MKKLIGSNHGESRGRKLNTNDFGTGVVAVDNNLRGGRKPNTNAIELNLFKNTKNDYILYTFYVDIPIMWQHITNGEKVLIQPDISRKPNTNYIELKSSNPVHLPLNPMGFELNGGYYG